MGTLLTHFVHSRAPFMLEVGLRTEAENGEGHLACDAYTGTLLLRTSEQCSERDRKDFENVGKHKFFNMNNAWLDLEALKKQMVAADGVLPLPIVERHTTWAPRSLMSTPVIQLETRMAAAVQCFDGASAIVVPSTRFVKARTSGELLALRSDAYTLTSDYRLELPSSSVGAPYVKMIPSRSADQLNRILLGRPPSLARCNVLILEGDVRIDENVIFKGDVSVKGPGILKSGQYENRTVQCED